MQGDIIGQVCATCGRPWTGRVEQCPARDQGLKHAWQYDTPVRDDSEVSDF